MSVKQQQALDRLYASDNVLTIKITMPQADWDAVRTEQPAGGPCNFDWTGDSRYTWHKAASVKISGTAFPAATTFTGVGVKKKSFCGSINDDKPCLHIDFGKFSDTVASAAENLIGSRYLTLNNSIQDPSYVRQPLGYTLLGMAGLPHSRCNFARVLVNGKPIGQGVANVNSPGVYVNAEPIMKRYIERNFNGNLNGNLYELEHTDDLISARIPFIGVESLSTFADKADLKLADDQIAATACRAQIRRWTSISSSNCTPWSSSSSTGTATPTTPTHLPVQRRERSGLTRPRQRSVQDDSLGHRPNPQTSALLQVEHQRTDREAGPRRRHPPHAVDQPDPDVSGQHLRPRGPTGPTHPPDRPHGSSPRRVRSTQRRLRNRGRAPTTPAGRLGRLPLRRTTGNQTDLRPQRRHRRVPTRQQHRKHPGRASKPRELRDLPPSSPGQQR